MALFGNLGMSASRKNSALQTRRASVNFGARLAFGPDLPGVAPVQEVLETGTRPEPIPEEVEQSTGGIPELGSGQGDLHFEDFPSDEFEKVGEFSPQESAQDPPVLSPEQPAESPSGTEPRKKRVKTLAGRTDLPWVRKLQALRAKTSSSAPKSPPTQPSRKSYRLMA